MKPFHLVGIMTIGISLVWPLVALADIQRDCNDNAVVFCGAATQSELMQKISAGDTKHTSADISQIEAQNGIQVSLIGSTVDGTVMKDGRVIVDGKTVATGAWSVGRQNILGSTPQGNVFIRPTTVSFIDSSLAAFVMIQNGQFKWAVIKTCGNPVVANAVIAQTSAYVAPPPPPPPPPAPVLVQPTVQPAAAPVSTPRTGPDSFLVNLAGAIALWYSYKFYRRSRVGLKDSMMER